MNEKNKCRFLITLAKYLVSVILMVCWCPINQFYVCNFITGLKNIEWFIRNSFFLLLENEKEKLANYAEPKLKLEHEKLHNAHFCLNYKDSSNQQSNKSLLVTSFINNSLKINCAFPPHIQRRIVNFKSTTK